MAAKLTGEMAVWRCGLKQTGKSKQIGKSFSVVPPPRVGGVRSPKLSPTGDHFYGRHNGGAPNRCQIQTASASTYFRYRNLEWRIDKCKNTQELNLYLFRKTLGKGAAPLRVTGIDFGLSSLFLASTDWTKPRPSTQGTFHTPALEDIKGEPTEREN